MFIRSSEACVDAIAARSPHTVWGYTRSFSVVPVSDGIWLMKESSLCWSAVSRFSQLVAPMARIEACRSDSPPMGSAAGSASVLARKLCESENQLDGAAA